MTPTTMMMMTTMTMAHCCAGFLPLLGGEGARALAGNVANVSATTDTKFCVGYPLTKIYVLDWLALAVEEIIGAFRFSCENLNNSRSFRFASEKFANRSS
jgi:hypothetical protein